MPRSKGATVREMPQRDGARVKVSRQVIANRYLSKMSESVRREIAAEAKVRGAVQTAKERALTVSAVLELRIQAIERTLAETRAWIAEQQRRAA
jgi:hypothetical protein